MKRREFLKTLGGAGLAIPGWLAGTGCGAVAVPSDPTTGLSLGYVCGDVTHQSALVWLRATAGSQVALQFAEGPDFTRANTTPAIAVNADADNSGVIALDSLRPATLYYYR